MGTLQRIYDRSPAVVQDLMASAKGAVNNRRRYGKTYWEQRAWLQHYDHWSLDQMMADQQQRLTEFVRFGATESPFYQRFWADVDWHAVQGSDDLPELPILEKELLREHMSELYTVDPKHSTEGHTGGTTGKSLVVRYTLNDGMKRMAMLDHFKAKHGFENRKMRKATFSGKHIVPPGYQGDRYWRYNAPARQMLYSTFDMSEANLHHYVAGLNDFKPVAMEGFFTSMCDLASYIERHELPLTFTPTAIFPTSEAVTPRGRALLERVFKTKVYDQYASSEGAPFITECSAGKLHLEPASGIFEPLPGAIEPDGTCETLVTSFTTHGTPLVRYQIGDALKFGSATGDRHCECGYAAPTVAGIRGRSSDHLLRADGTKINGGHVANLFKNMPNALVQAQAIQTELGSVTINLVIDPQHYEADFDDLLRQEFVHTFGHETELHINHVDEIPREKSGKLRLIKNNVSSS
ncbi:phenylacetate--CoA ligase family protein [Parenemella sanctibonifatiensis]|uniref:Phenylacetate--CoA ligase family protein n=1 Tax=Parenemella sanctibonifatiensis TaxID=2016505 RepID=A0A255EL82_9ACTN|nr:phenylacetate--CoA ligase family protein [Parenemella sanctibonifatiensis]OYN92287.1 hypothetical protein CGZ91_01920 [Parenemella sanctibonifatiensis]